MKKMAPVRCCGAAIAVSDLGSPLTKKISTVTLLDNHGIGRVPPVKIAVAAFVVENKKLLEYGFDLVQLMGFREQFFKWCPSKRCRWHC
jgi:hypothetical protein